VLRIDPAAEEIFAAIREGRPLGSAGTQLVHTPPSEATTRVAVVDAGSGETAEAAEGVLADAGFDVAPGIWSASEAGIDLGRAAIVYRPAASAQAQVVAAYFPTLPLVESTELRGAQVAIVVTPSYEFVPPGETPGDDSNGCPAV